MLAACSCIRRSIIVYAMYQQCWFSCPRNSFFFNIKLICIHFNFNKSMFFGFSFYHSIIQCVWLCLLFFKLTNGQNSNSVQRHFRSSDSSPQNFNQTRKFCNCNYRIGFLNQKFKFLTNPQSHQTVRLMIAAIGVSTVKRIFFCFVFIVRTATLAGQFDTRVLGRVVCVLVFAKSSQKKTRSIRKVPRRWVKPEFSTTILPPPSIHLLYLFIRIISRRRQQQKWTGNCRN